MEDNIKNNKKIGISVIMTVYQCENYLRKCIESVLSQTFRNFEYIIIDDGSTDNGGKIIDEYAEKDGRINAIHQENKGAPASRNVGIDMAQGKYLYIMDSDDWLDKCYLKSLYDAAEEKDAQIVIAGYTFEYRDKRNNRFYAVMPPEAYFSDKEAFRNNFHTYINHGVIAPQWNKLYRADYIKDRKIYVPKMKGADMVFNMRAFYDVERVAVIDAAGYYYLQERPDSFISRESKSYIALYKRRNDQFKSVLHAYRHWGIKDREIIRSVYGYYAAALVGCIMEIAISDSTDKTGAIRKLLDDKLNNHAFKVGHISSKVLSVAAIPARLHSVWLCLLMGWSIGFVKLYLRPIYNLLMNICGNKAKVGR